MKTKVANNNVILYDRIHYALYLDE